MCPDITDAEARALDEVTGGAGPSWDHSCRDLLAAYRAGAGAGPGGRLPTGDVVAALTGGAVPAAAPHVHTEIGEGAHDHG